MNGSALSGESIAYRTWLWVCIFAAFMVVHTPMDTIVAFSSFAGSFLFNTFKSARWVFGDESTANSTIQQSVVRLKGIVFLISLVTLCYPVAWSLKRTSFLWDPRQLKKRLLLCAAVFLALFVLIDPFRLNGLHRQYSEMSVSPFDAPRNWFYRRLLMPALAHYLGLEGDVFYYLYSMAVTFSLIFCVAAYFEHKGVKTGFVQLLSIATSGFIIFNFMAVGWADPMMDLLLLLLLFVADNDASRLSLLALSLATHEASVFILVPMILLMFPRRHWWKYFAVVALYFSLYLLSFRLDALTLVTSQVARDNKTGLDWVLLYPWRAIGGWFLTYKLLWLVLGVAVYKMIRAKDYSVALAVVSYSVIVPAALNVLTVDVYRHVAEGFCGLLIAWAYLARTGYFEGLIGKTIMGLNILVPSIYVGTNAGFRLKHGLYLWFCNLVGLQGWMAKW